MIIYHFKPTYSYAYSISLQANRLLPVVLGSAWEYLGVCLGLAKARRNRRGRFARACESSWTIRQTSVVVRCGRIKQKHISFAAGRIVVDDSPDHCGSAWE